MIDQKKYFLLHAPRQTGKTCCLLALADDLNREGRYRAVYANIEPAHPYRENVEKGMAVVVEEVSRGSRDQLGERDAPALGREIIAASTGGAMVGEFLTRWCERSPLPVVF